MVSEKELEKINATTWEDLNPDWAEDGDLTDRFNKSQFDGCPGCDQIEGIGVYVATEDLDVAVACRPCGWQVFGDCPSAAIEKWNARANPDTVPLHRAVGNQEQDIANGKLAGFCILCQVPYPCEYVGKPPDTVPDDEYTLPAIKYDPVRIFAAGGGKIEPLPIDDDDTVPDSRNWTEDFDHENGQYMHICIDCTNEFHGHKRRVLCKLCRDADAVPDSPWTTDGEIEVSE